MTSNTISIAVFKGGLKCPHKIQLNTECVGGGVTKKGKIHNSWVKKWVGGGGGVKMLQKSCDVIYGRYL